MKETLVLYILVNLIFFSFSIVPIWDLKKTSIDLLSNSNKIEYTMVDTTLHYKLRYIFRKIIKKENNSVKVINIFTCQFNNDPNNNLVVNQIVDFDEIESAYTDKNGKYYICPKGSHHVHYFQDGDSNLSILKPKEFENDSGEWELKCYQQNEKKVDGKYAWKKLFVFYLNKEEYIYQINENSKTMTVAYDYKINILSFRWTTEGTSDNIYTMYAINAYDKKVYIEQINFIITGEDTSVNIMANDLLFTLPKSNTKANLNTDSENSRFYYISYDEDSINITSGYTDNLYTISKAKSFTVYHNDKSPFEFIDNVKLKNIRFIPGTKYAYYKLYDEVQNKFYYGILDVELNQVVYNTDEDLINFEVYSTNSMLAVTSSSAYQICAITYNNKCISSCQNKIIFDIENGNQCGSSYDCSQYILIPNNICIYTCDPNLLYLENNKCGLCKDFQINKPYKMINSSGCLEEKINNTYYVNEELLLISCNENYSYIDGECKLTNCYETCEICSEKSTNSKDQKCLSCKNDFPILYQNNCLKNCPEKMYQNGNTCEKCQDICETCNKNGCTSCPEGYYLNSENHTCELCHEKCETCSAKGTDDNNNCIKCKNPNDKFEDGNCITICGERQYKTRRNTCEYCMKLCASCLNGDSCESCFNNYYLNNKNCYHCHENCNNCTQGGDNTHHNCLSCKNNNHYLVTGGEYENNCVEACPEDTVKDENHKICTYVPPINNTDKDETDEEEEEEEKKREDEEEKEEEEEVKEKEKTGKVVEKEKEIEKETVSSVNLDLIVWIFIFGTAFFLIIINIIFFGKNCCCKGKQEDVTETIQTELSEMNLIN